MRVKNITARFVQNLQESFWCDFQGQTRQRLKELLEKDAEQQMAEHLGLKWHGQTANRARGRKLHGPRHSSLLATKCRHGNRVHFDRA